MPYDESKGWIAQPKEYWYQSLKSDAEVLYPDLQWNEGSNNSIIKENDAGYYASWDLKVAFFMPKLVEEFKKKNIQIQSYNGKALTGIVRAFLTIPYVKQCIVIRAKASDLNCYLFLEVMDANGNSIKFTDLTSEQETELLNLGAETHAITKPRSQYIGGTTEAPITYGIIQGIGITYEGYDEKGVEIIINEIQTKGLAVMIKIRVIVKDGYVDALHKSTEVDAIREDFLAQFKSIQKAGVDFNKMNYVCPIKTDERDYMYDFDFYDAEDEATLVLMNLVEVEQFEYFPIPAEDGVEVDFIRQDGTLI